MINQVKEQTTQQHLLGKIAPTCLFHIQGPYPLAFRAFSADPLVTGSFPGIRGAQLARDP